MTADIARQLQALCRAVLMGGGLGVLYDLMRIVRRRVPSPVLGGILDFLFWAAATAALFLFSHETWAGQVRLYGAAFCMLVGGSLSDCGVAFVAGLLLHIFILKVTVPSKMS